MSKYKTPLEGYLKLSKPNKGETVETRPSEDVNDDYARMQQAAQVLGDVKPQAKRGWNPFGKANK